MSSFGGPVHERHGVKHLYDEDLRRFPEVAPYVSEGDEELPYLVVGYIADWLLSVASPAIDPSAVQRVVDFDRWCMDQPRGATAADDIMTIQIVGFREELFKHDELLPLVPQLMTHEEPLMNGKYLTQWVGADRLQAALRLSGSKTKQRQKMNPRPKTKP